MKSTSICCSLAALATLSALAMSPVSAAPGPVIPGVGGPSAITVGAYFPSGGDAKDRGGSTQINGEFQYTLPVPNPLDVPARTVASIGIQTGSQHGDHSTIVPLTVGLIAGANGSPTAAGNAFYGAGVGVYFENQSGISTATRLGGYGELGYNFTSTFFVDAKYQFVDHGQGPLVNVGMRF